MKYLKLFEKTYNDEEEFVDNIPNFVESYYNDNYTKSFDFEHMCYYLDPWDYIDDDKYVKEHIDGEIDYQQSDFENIYDSDYERDEYMIPFIMDRYKHKDNTNETKKDIENYILKRYCEEYIGVDLDDEESVYDHKEEINNAKGEDLDTLMEDLEPDIVREILQEVADTYDFIKDILENRYMNSSAKEIISEFENEAILNEPVFWEKDPYNLVYYVDEEKMAEDMPDPEMEEMVREIEPSTNSNFQLEFFKHYPERYRDLIDNDYLSKEILEVHDFQDKYFQYCLEQDEDDLEDLDEEEIENPDFEIQIGDIDVLKSYGAEIHKDLIKKYDIEYLIDADDLGLI